MKAKLPLVSIIIPTYNHGRFICDAVDSVLAQTYNPMEIIVVDDGSTDNTQQQLKKYRNTIINIHKANQGLSAARNTGLQHAKGKIIAILDADDMWYPQKLDQQVQKMLSNQNIGLVGCGRSYVDEYGVLTGGAKKKTYRSKREFLSELYLKNAVGTGGSGAIILKDCFDKVGGFDETLRSAEDWDMWLRVSAVWDVDFVEEELVKIRVLENSMSSPAHAARMLENELKMLNKNFHNGVIPVNPLLKRKILSYRYFSAARAYKQAQNRQEVRKFMRKAIGENPLCVFNKTAIALILYGMGGCARV
ncbi:MAG: glycosyltransferase family 2 protein [Candidatus Omnitrophica bacterium]|nr:glycosyltransferase family 2 protein [Candidatus Omnitrophota bacterium]MCB9746952.1 glycosyltransferase family 2 protein [Candidatus Omnitrophota bacterium]